MKTIAAIKDRKIGQGFPVFVVAEISANHLQEFKNAARLIRCVKKAGADAVKFQTYTPDTLTIDSDSGYFRIKHPRWGGQTLYELYKKAYTPWKWFKRLKGIADDEGIIFFSTAFDKTAVDFLEELDVAAHKIASFELVDLPLIEYVAKTKKPIIISTGMATVLEIGEAVRVAKAAGAKDVFLLKCVSSYPARPEEMNLATIEDMKKRFKCPVGLSDHTLGSAVSIAAVSLGADLLEKHITLSREILTPDGFFSIEPAELKELIHDIRITEKALGKPCYGATKGEKKSLLHRRSLFTVNNITKGELFTEENVRSIRPANGIKPKYMKEILGKRAKRNIKKGTPLSWGLVS